MTSELARSRWEHERREARRKGLLTTSEAADLMGVTTSKIKTWKRLGLITDSGGGKGYPSLFDPDEVRTAPQRRVNLRERGACTVEGCTELHWARGKCSRHYRADLQAAGRLAPRPATPEQNAEQTLRKGGALHPPQTLPYRALARTCPECGNLLTTPDHLIRKDAGPLPACPRCRVAKVTRFRKKRLATDADYRKAEAERTERIRRRTQERLLAAARNKGKEWTGPELEIAAREDLSASQVAKMLGRTLYAVKHMRRKIKDDPKKARLAGLDTDVARKAQP